MASALIVLLLGCWLAGHSGVWGGREFRKPTISVSPSRVVALGGNVTIRCKGSYRSMKFFLRKPGHPNLQVVPDGTMAQFPIRSVGREDGGNYTCQYRSIKEQKRWSYPSGRVEIIVADPSLPRPSISLSPTGVITPGANVTIRCQGQHRDVRFFLHKAGDRNLQRHVDPAGDGAEFHIPNVGRQHGGNYSCSYRNRSEHFISSQPSDPVQLVIAGGSESPAPPDLSSPIIAGVSAAAAVLLLLLVAFVCFRKTRARKGAAPRPSSPLGVLKAPALQDPVYASIDEGKEPQTLEPDPSTYTELDGQTLQPSVYAVINLSQGAQQ